MKKLKKMLYWILGIVAVLAVTVLLVLQHPDFGRTPINLSDNRLEPQKHRLAADMRRDQQPSIPS